MAVQMKTIKQKMETISNIKKVTKAMEMVSTSKMRKTVARRNESLLFSEESRKILINLHKFHHLDHPFFQERDRDKILVILVAANRGLCGAYNANLDKEFKNFLNSLDDGIIVEVIGVGKEAQKIALRHKLTLLANFEEFSELYEPDEVRSLLHFVMDAFSTDQYRKIMIVYTEFINSLSFKTRVRSFLPLDPREFENLDEGGREEDTRSYIFEPSKKEVLDYAIHYVLLTVLYQYLLEALASEYSARVIAMKNASENAQEILDELVISFNRARQAAITQEIAEIVGALSALSS